MLEVAILNVKEGKESEFEAAFCRAQKIMSNIEGYVSRQLKKCVENQFILLVNWQTIENHTVDFRGSSQYQEWKGLLHHFYDPFPAVKHYTGVFP